MVCRKRIQWGTWRHNIRNCKYHSPFIGITHVGKYILILYFMLC